MIARVPSVYLDCVCTVSISRLLILEHFVDQRSFNSNFSLHFVDFIVIG